ncbi:pyridoxamine 5'-phosphate oxidase family protein [Rhizobium leguminosarum]|uniref:pyridoxamine 5'-phosphate oxidase family protein n=1 Tax=Rhizobium leguminosarum TaxID=384 RepID=UPI0014417116|nr:pyridoxamine 5'-phosphate oxidase family protein [Rhizobium leguminosarum]MBY5814565.1 pyridoxamine 5'-phosphate oxidase family protein [Rhizobium leguminosarum]MBY5867764.1 pyridoxamine 5'-phosphate oxidase family protein [Rhizobium leguminosarum]NKL02964.1 pyridoxamine 5'-phosphate oxidase family protein [Rhizobium leguminosarum bv. viciae]NKL78107.1 pyridoxamine 5'-phosphate oxidase family protein [Rhizobium leguminosarum bv. viciae]NKM04742.1 pyridoxamine 5'-phosphate oxidase family pro
MSLHLRELTQGECYEVLEHARFGHLACCRNGQPYVVAVYFAFSGNMAYSFTMPGKKLSWMRENEKVCLQVEQQSNTGGWTSVVVDGVFEEFPDNDLWRSERIRAWSLLQAQPDWWEVGSLKPSDQPTLFEPPHVFFGILVHTVSGRRASRED